MQAARARIDEAIAGGDDYVLVVAGEPQAVAFGLAVLQGGQAAGVQGGQATVVQGGQATVTLVGVEPAHSARGSERRS